MVPPSSRQIPRACRYSGYRLPLSRFTYRAVTVYGEPSQVLLLRYFVHCAVHTPKTLLLSVWPLPLSLAATRRISFDFSSSAYLDVSVQRVPLITLWIHVMIAGSSPVWFPNSEICGSKLICSSPQLIAACHVLRRLLMPRHSPYALFSLNSQRQTRSVCLWNKRFAFFPQTSYLSLSLIFGSLKFLSFLCLSFANNCLN